MVDESKDRAQLYNTMNKTVVNREKPEVNQDEPEVKVEAEPIEKDDSPKRTAF